MIKYKSLTYFYISTYTYVDTICRIVLRNKELNGEGKEMHDSFYGIGYLASPLKNEWMSLEFWLTSGEI